METGVILFIIGIIFSVFQSMSEKKHKTKEKPVSTPQIRTLDDFKRNVIERTHPVVESSQPVIQAQAEKRPRPDKSKEARMQAIMADTHLSEKQKAQRISSITEGDLTVSSEPLLDFSKHHLVQGIVLSEVLAPPKSRR
ncbi:hypothetical protein [Macrococcus equipercicus]|uniref:Uncharacterized protein n=1 Tax=Macrococcus equipercicus TaxID=69967 RepID=A0A9Q9BV94_9STAP|nr:hypothetical protein [Macrococcus equipercicus]KAA1040069.1 hypothetical protein ERX35_003530 [Macrococcus equipercicus]UTH12982.1 hypothetical protein KFV11_06775 [Macrococcus equipercicus]